MKTLIFTDLDNSLIFTKKKIVNFNKKYWIQFTYGQNNESYIHKNVLELINNTLEHTNSELIIVTSRNLESYKKTFFYLNNEWRKKIKYIINNFGKDIYYGSNLKKVKEYKINYDKKLYLKYINNFINYINKITPIINGIKKINIIDNTYVEFKLYDNQTHIKNILKNLINNMFSNKFSIYESANTLSFYPIYLDKVKAVKYILNKEKEIFSIGIGDSLSDKKFLKLMDLKILPKNNQFNI